MEKYDKDLGKIREERAEGRFFMIIPIPFILLSIYFYDNQGVHLMACFIILFLACSTYGLCKCVKADKEEKKIFKEVEDWICEAESDVVSLTSKIKHELKDLDSDFERVKELNESKEKDEKMTDLKELINSKAELLIEIERLKEGIVEIKQKRDKAKYEDINEINKI